jgi:hypothetical protein
MSETKRVKTYVRPDNSAVLTCPHCGSQKAIPVESFRGRKSTIKIKCACSNIFYADLEFRKKKRKRTNLRGTYINQSQKNRRGPLIVQNISLGGLAFSSIDIKDFNVGDEVRKDAIVVEVRTYTIACVFERGGEFAYDGPLGFYIMS